MPYRTRLIALFSLFTCAAFAVENPQLEHSDVTQHNSKPIILSCPKASQLFKDPTTRFWKSSVYTNDWKAYDSSFLTQIAHFSGAQFIGNTVGHISCIYNGGKGSSALPVILHFGSLTHEPSNQHGLYKWQPLKKGWKNCVSYLPSDCPFTVLQQKTTSNVYDVIENLTPQKPLNDGVTF